MIRLYNVFSEVITTGGRSISIGRGITNEGLLYCLLSEKFYKNFTVDIL